MKRKIRLALQAQLRKNLRSASMVMKTSPMRRARCIWENHELRYMGAHARMALPPSLPALEARVSVI